MRCPPSFSLQLQAYAVYTHVYSNFRELVLRQTRKENDLEVRTCLLAAWLVSRERLQTK